MINRVSYSEFRPANTHASRVGRGNRSSGSNAEKLLQAAFRSRGFAFETNVRALPGVPDIVFPRWKVTVFCDGDFWHGRNWSSRRESLARGTNAEYWIAKIEANRRRDRQVNRMLRNAGWSVIRIWERDIHQDSEKVANRVVRKFFLAR
jgi:DNA mismatch endonuclease (patch repair protein)